MPSDDSARLLGGDVGPQIGRFNLRERESFIAEHVATLASPEFAELSGRHRDEVAYELAAAFRFNGDRERATHLFERLVVSCRQRSGPRSVEQVYALCGLAGCRGAIGRFDEAVALIRHAAELAEALGDSLHPVLIDIWNTLASWLIIAGRIDEAAVWLDFVHDAITTNPGVYDPSDRLLALYTLAKLHRLRGETQLATDRIHEVLNCARMTYDDINLEWRAVLGEWAKTQESAGDWPAAEATIRDALDDIAFWARPEHPIVGVLWMNLADLLLAQSRTAEALDASHRAALAFCADIDGHIGGLWSVRVTAALARFLEKDWREVERIADETLQLAGNDARIGDDYRRYLRALRLRALAELGRQVEVVAHLDELRRDLPHDFRRESYHDDLTRLNAGWLLQWLGRGDEARLEFLRVVRARELRFGVDHSETRAAREIAASIQPGPRETVHQVRSWLRSLRV